MENVSKGAKELIKKILVPTDKRMSLADIFQDAWILKEAHTSPLKLSFAKLTNFSKYSKMKKLAATYIATQLSEK